MSAAPSACFLCDKPALFPGWESAEGTTRYPYTVDCDGCGQYAITREAIQRIEIRPVAKSGIRFEIFRLRSLKNPRPLVDLHIVEHFSVGFTPLPSQS
jgi:hypothetical protein